MKRNTSGKYVGKCKKLYKCKYLFPFSSPIPFKTCYCIKIIILYFCVINRSNKYDDRTEDGKRTKFLYFSGIKLVFF